MEMTEFQNPTATPSHPGPLVAPDRSGHPDDIVDDPRLTVQEKRAVLASWASDANAVPHLPALRQLPDGSIIKVDAIMRALKVLDGLTDPRPVSGGRGLLWKKPFNRRRSWEWRTWSRNRRGPDNDDDPPPCPAYAARPPRSGGGAAHAVAEPALA
jgi:hypothetical protein